MESNYEQEGLPLSKIIEFDNGYSTYKIYNNTEGYITGGEVYNDKIYYTLYNEDTGFFELKFIKYGSFNDTPNLIYENLKSGDLILVNGKLYISDSKKYYKYGELDNTIEYSDYFKKVSENYTYKHKNLYFVININEKDSSSFNLDIIDGDTKEILKTVDDYISFKLEEEMLIIYTSNGIKKFDLTNNNII
ncbi:MAG: hypothetical protein ACK5LT_06100 [Lachnospirales bacterium]